MEFEKWFEDLSYELYQRLGHYAGLSFTQLLEEHRAGVRAQWESLYAK